MTTDAPRNPHDPRDWPDSFVIWDWKTSRYVDPSDSIMQAAKDALTALAMLRGFTQEDVALIAQTAADGKEWADAVETKLMLETGIRFHLTQQQWGLLALELSHHGGVQ